MDWLRARLPIGVPIGLIEGGMDIEWSSMSCMRGRGRLSSVCSEAGGGWSGWDGGWGDDWWWTGAA